MQKYKCHKIVEAMKIETIEYGPGGIILNAENGDYIAPSAGYGIKHTPQAGGYYVRYEDGYESYSPAKAFEEGYRPLVEIDKVLMLEVRELIQTALFHHSKCKRGSGAGIGMDSADLDVVIDGNEYNINIKPR